MLEKAESVGSYDVIDEIAGGVPTNGGRATSGYPARGRTGRDPALRHLTQRRDGDKDFGPAGTLALVVSRVVRSRRFSDGSVRLSLGHRCRIRYFSV